MFPTLGENRKEALSWEGLKKTVAFRQKQLTYGDPNMIAYEDPTDTNSPIIGSEWNIFISYNLDLTHIDFDTNSIPRLCD